MTPELRWLAWSVVLGIVQILAASMATSSQRPGGLQWSAGARDEPQPPPAGVAGRLTRARDNFLETFPFFAAAVLAAHLGGRSGALTGWGTLIYFWARVAYVPLYASGVPYLRSIVWGVAMVGLFMVLASLFG